MRRIIPGVVALFVSLSAQAATGMTPGPDLSELTESTPSSRERLDALLRRIRDGREPRHQARSLLTRLLSDARDSYYRSGGSDTAPAAWFFPVAGRDIRAITGGKRHGYNARHYNFYDGNRHGGHPSLDIFIRDRNRDCRDDATGAAVHVLSMTSGVVVAAEDTWEEGSRLRGGKYLWIYDPGNDLLVYYAHNEELLVKTGDLVRPGDVVATIGRSGYNAAKRRSPTHLHLTVLRVDRGAMTPTDVYHFLKTARNVL